MQTAIKYNQLDSVLQGVLSQKWWPHPENIPQQQAYKCNAKWLGYGGAAGGGKSDLLVGKLITRHSQAVIYRRENTQIKDLRSRAADIISDSEKGLNKVEGTYKHSNGKTLNFAAMQYEDDKKKYQGRARDGIGFDEATEFTRSQVQYVTIWNRTADSNQDTQVIMTFNPPQNIEGEWIIDFFAPWLDEDYYGLGGKAESGEIRYAYIKEDDNGEFIDVWVESEGQHVDPDTGKTYNAESRCFIAARVEDNPYMMESGYDKTLDSLPDELKNAMRYGIMRRAIKDNALQVIPREWVKLAQERWDKATLEPVSKLTAIGVDISRGGRDSTVIYKRYNNWFAPAVTHQGVDTDDGPKVAGLIMPYIADDCPVNLDVVAVGTSVYDTLKANYKNTVPLNGAASSSMLDRSGKFKMRNLRAELWWKLREALDPVHGDDLMLPPDSGLLKDLTAPRYKVQVGGIQIEDKKEVKKRIGKSPDMAEALMYALYMPEKKKRTFSYPSATGRV